jgi:hypothetical protein
VYFDWSISLGQVLTAITVSALALFAWRDLQWRVKNLETWRAEHMVDADARDQLLRNSEKMLAQLKTLVERGNGHGRRRFPESD